MINDTYTYFVEDASTNKFSLITNILICIIILGLTSVKSLADSTKLAAIRQSIKQKNLNWTAGESWITRLSPQERKKIFMTSYTPPVVDKADIITLPQITELPSNLDWRNISLNDYQGNYVTSIKNQGQCGSCWAFSAVAQVESWWLIDKNRPDTTLDLSEQTLLSNNTIGSCNGGSTADALEWIQDNGIPPEWCFEYSANDSIPLDSAYVYWQNHTYTIPGWSYITSEEADINNIKNALLYHPVSAYVEIYSDFNYYVHGVYEPTNISGSTGIWHAILIVGWNDADSCWICKNSWGPDWGETVNAEPADSIAQNGGYFRIKWGVCHIGENVPFIWKEVGSKKYNISTDSDIIDLILIQGDSIKKSITINNSGQKDIDFAALRYNVSEKFHVDNFYAYEGTSWWCGVPEIGGYDNHWLQYLQTPQLDLSNTRNAELTWKGFWSVEDPTVTAAPFYPWDGWDGCNVWISTDGGKNFSVIEPEYPEYDYQHLWSFGSPYEGWDLGTDIAGWGGSIDRWTDVKFDLSSYKSDSVIIRWAFASDLYYCTEDDPLLYGFLVDNIKIADGNKTLFENNGKDDGTMTVEGYGRENIDWLKLINGVGTISAEKTFDLDITIDTKNTSPGDYKALVKINISDTVQNSFNIPINLKIIPKNDLSLELYNNYPNPFNLHTRISYNLPQKSYVTLKVYDIRGRKVRTLVNEEQYPGLKQIIWDGNNDSNAIVSSGMYVYTLRTEKQVISKKMLLIR